MNKTVLVTSIFISFLFSACSDDNRFFEQNTDISNATWNRDQTTEFNFTVNDTSSKYHLVYTVRNSGNYPYYNLYLKAQLIDSTGLIIDNFDSELYLFNATTGKPFGASTNLLGDALGDIYDGRYLCQSYYKFPKPGNYTFSIQQGMRKEEALEGIMAIGLRIEQVE